MFLVELHQKMQLKCARNSHIRVENVYNKSSFLYRKLVSPADFTDQEVDEIQVQLDYCVLRSLLRQ